MNINTPHPQVLRREGDLNADERIELIAYSELVNSMVNVGTYLLEWEATDNSINQENLAQVVTVSMFRRLLDLFDSCATLIRVGSTTSCSALIRIALELTVELEFLLLDNTTTDRKTKAYILMGHEGALRNWQKIKEGKNYPQLQEEAKDAIDDLQIRIDDLYFEDVRDDYKAAVFAKNGRKMTSVKWYTVIDQNVDSIFKLMDKLDQLGIQTNYTLYSVLSNYIHSSGLIEDGFYSDETKKPIIRGIRINTGYERLVYGLVEIGMKIYKTLARRRTLPQQHDYDKAVEDFYLQYKQLYSN